MFGLVIAVLLSIPLTIYAPNGHTGSFGMFVASRSGLSFGWAFLVELSVDLVTYSLVLFALFLILEKVLRSLHILKDEDE